jgi:hypothetical protein
MAIEQLRNFRTLNAVLKCATEEECEILLLEEKQNERRHEFLVRIYGRLNKLRATRERLELIQLAQK